jgi:hypothetical protein
MIVAAGNKIILMRHDYFFSGYPHKQTWPHENIFNALARR